MGNTKKALKGTFDIALNGGAGAALAADANAPDWAVATAGVGGALLGLGKAVKDNKK